MGAQVSTYRDKAAQKRGRVRFAWLTRTRALRERGGAIAAWAADIVQHAVDGRTEHATAELEALERVAEARNETATESPGSSLQPQEPIKRVP